MFKLHVRSTIFPDAGVAGQDAFLRDRPELNNIVLPEYKPYRIFREPNINPFSKTLNQLRVEKYLDTSHFR